jgi:hypothetical protein
VQGIINSNGGTINTGTNNDCILGFGGAHGIINYNGSTIDAGSGNDSIIGSGGTYGIYNYNGGTIKAGAGDDLVDALIGGFAGEGITDLGTGNDTLKGFGSGTFRGGLGSDTLVFNTGTYTITAGVGTGNYVINGIMKVSGFELFGLGASVTIFSEAVAAGSVTFS